MPSSEPDPLPVRVDIEDIREKRQRTKCPCVFMNDLCKYIIFVFCKRSTMSILISIREYFVKMHLSFSLKLGESHKPSEVREEAIFS